MRGSWFGVRGSWFSVRGSWFVVWDSWFGVWGLGFRVRVWCLGSGFRAQNFGFRVAGLGWGLYLCFSQPGLDNISFARPQPTGAPY